MTTVSCLSIGLRLKKKETTQTGANVVLREDVILYKLNYVEQNRRGGRDPWSSRHVAVYHHHRPDRDLFILIHCTEETALVKSLSVVSTRDQDFLQLLGILTRDPLRLHELVISSYADNWGPYLRYLGESFSDIVRRVASFCNQIFLCRAGFCF